MDAIRIEEIVASLEHEREAARVSRALAEVRHGRERDFERQWWAAYAHAIDPEDDDSWPETTTRRILAIGQGVIDRHWDYYAGELLAVANLREYLEMALITLRWACAADYDAVLVCLKAQREYVRGVGEAHNDLFDMLKVKSERGLPVTPPLNQPQMAQVLGITPSQFRARSRGEANQWRTKDSPKDGHARKWWNIDRQIQSDALQEIRKKFPEKIWLGNRPEK